MTLGTDLTHAPSLQSWVASANDAASDFPIQNLPFGRFRREGSSEAWRIGVFERAEIAVDQPTQRAHRIELTEFVVGVHVDRYAIGGGYARAILMNEDAWARAERCTIGQGPFSERYPRLGRDQTHRGMDAKRATRHASPAPHAHLTRQGGVRGSAAFSVLEAGMSNRNI